MHLTRPAAILAFAASLALASAVAAADTPPPSGVLNLSASASIEVAKDLMSVTLSTSREGPDANAVQSALKQALDAALAEARRAAKPAQVDVQTGNFSIHPRYSNKGQMAGWQGTAELLVEGRDMPAIAQLVGRISSMTLQRVGYGLSRELREKSEGDVTAQAVARYRAKAAEHAKLFGYSAYTIREVSVTADQPPGGPIPMMRSQAMAMQEDAALPVEAGKAPVMVTVSGTVQMTR